LNELEFLVYICPALFVAGMMITIIIKVILDYREMERGYPNLGKAEQIVPKSYETNKREEKKITKKSLRPSVAPKPTKEEVVIKLNEQRVPTHNKKSVEEIIINDKVCRHILKRMYSEIGLRRSLLQGPYTRATTWKKLDFLKKHGFVKAYKDPSVKGKYKRNLYRLTTVGKIFVERFLSD